MAHDQSRPQDLGPTTSAFRLEYCIACNYWCGDTMICNCCSKRGGHYFPETHFAPELFDDYDKWNSQA